MWSLLVNLSVFLYFLSSLSLSLSLYFCSFMIFEYWAFRICMVMPVCEASEQCYCIDHLWSDDLHTHNPHNPFQPYRMGRVKMERGREPIWKSVVVWLIPGTKRWSVKIRKGETHSAKVSLFSPNCHLRALRIQELSYLSQNKHHLFGGSMRDSLYNNTYVCKGPKNGWHYKFTWKAFLKEYFGTHTVDIL